MAYVRSDFSPLRESLYGIGFHWTTHAVPATGDPLPFEDAVGAFDVDRFVSQAVDTGAGHVLITSAHAIHHLPCPNPEVDRVMSGRTCRRDLIGEIGEALRRENIKLVFYYHHGTDGPLQDPEWFAASGANLPDQSRFYENYCRILGWMGEKYGDLVTAYWFDAGYGLVARGEVPWEKMTLAAKAGHPGRLVTYNSGIENHLLYTPCQDYWAGELCRINFTPRGELTPSGLPWHAFVGWHTNLNPEYAMCAEWNLTMGNRDAEFFPPSVESVVMLIDRFSAVGGTTTFNLLCYQDGTAHAVDMAVMKQVKEIISGRKKSR